MRNASAALITLLNSNVEFLVADLLTIVPADGSTPVRLTSADFDVSAVSQYDNASHTFSSVGPRFTRGRVKVAVGLAVDDLQLTIAPDNILHTLAGLPWAQAVRQGFLDEAQVMLERAFVPAWTDFSAGTIITFAGRVGKTDPQRNQIDLEVACDLELLAETQMPRNVFQPGCLHTLFDSGCALSKAAFQVSSAAAAGSTVSSIAATVSGVSGYYDLGTITFTSGVNAGVSRAVKHFTAGSPSTIVLARPFSVAPAIGDTFTMTPGCDKAVVLPVPSANAGDVRFGTCNAKFNNLLHAKAFPFVPLPENAL